MADDEKDVDSAPEPKKKSPIILIVVLVIVGLALAAGISIFVTTKIMADATNNDDGYWEVHKIAKDAFLVDGGKIIRISQVTNSRNTEQIIRLQNTMKAMGIMDEIKRLGVKNGDTIIVGKLELEYWDDEVYK